MNSARRRRGLRTLFRYSGALPFAALLLAGLVGTALAQRPPASRLSAKVIDEKIDTARPVSKAGPVGIAAAPDRRTSTEPATVWIDVPQNVSGTITLNVLSIDGRFVASYQLDVAPGPRRSEVVQLPTREQRKRDQLLPTYAHDAGWYLSYSAVTRRGTQAEPAMLLRVARSEQALSDTARTSVLVRSDNAQTVVLQPRLLSPTGSRLGPERQCKRIEGRERFEYDFACEAEFRELADSVRISRIRDGESLPPIDVQTP